MNLEELKQAIVKETGIPASLLKGETIEENIALAKALLAYKKEVNATKPQTTAEQFRSWTTQQIGSEQIDTTAEILTRIEQQAKEEFYNHPGTNESKQAETNTATGKTTKQQFAEWLGLQTSFNAHNSIY